MKPIDTDRKSLEGVKPSPGYCCLVVDDYEPSRILLHNLLTPKGYRVYQATNGKEAIEIFNRVHPDIVLMDLMMPVMNGYEATRAIKALAGDQFVPIMFLTSLNNDEEALKRCVDEGGDDFLTKPFSLGILEYKIRALLRVREMHLKLAKQKEDIGKHHVRMQREQEIAERIFSNIVHRGNLSDPCFRYLVSPAALFNGDLLLAARRPEGGHRVLLGDFTGHGLPAAVGAIPVSEMFYVMTAKGCTMDLVVCEINKKLKATLPSGLFMAACILDIDADSGQFHVWNGGMPDILIRGDKTVVRIPSRHLPLGVVQNENLGCTPETISVEPGSRIYLYSDGLVEARNGNHEMFGDERIESCLAGLPESQSGFHALRVSLSQFRGYADQDDDITLLEISPDLIADEK
jgi:CheY-like chemotaxis protein